MNIYPSFTNLRSHISYKFSALRTRALRDLFWSKLTGKNFALATFPGEHSHLNKKLLGVEEIRMDQIIGTLNRCSDFDRAFRPLKKHLLNHWVDTFIRMDRGKWSPIVVHKIGERYYVEDGHHRVSVARATGMVFMEAEIWEYRSETKAAESLEVIQCVERSSSKVYAIG